MPQVKYDINFERSNLSISASDLVSRYFFGIPLVDPSGNSMSEKQINFYTEAAQTEMEGYLNIKLPKQVVEETISYMRDEYLSWGHIPVSYQVNEPISLNGVLGTIEQVTYPPEWLSAKKSSEPSDVHRQVFLVPTTGKATTNSVVYGGISPHVGWFGSKIIPNYWTIRYCTGYDVIPADILDAVGKIAAFNVFNILGDLQIGVGIASTSIGIDGLSQSISTTSSATNATFGARIIQFQKELKISLPKLKAKYGGYQFVAV